MKNEYELKSVLNCIARLSKSEKYAIIPFENVDSIVDIDFSDIEHEYDSVDKYLDFIKKRYKDLSLHIYIRPEKVPALLRSIGYILNIDNRTSYFSGREQELLKMHVVLNKKIKNNVLLVGNPGVGKTRLVEEYAIRNNLRNIFVVECAKLVGNCEYRGSFEQKVVDLLDYVKENNLILFFDEIHTLIDLGKSTGGISITDILKPYLLNSDLIFIGATTLKEMAYFVKDEAFKRRFTVIKLEEPSDEILKRITTNFETAVLHKMIVNDADVSTIIENLAEKLPKLSFPDKLIDFLDYLASFSEVANKPVDTLVLLEEYIYDQTDISAYA